MKRRSKTAAWNGKRNVLRFDLKESRERVSVRDEGEGQSFHVEGPKTEKPLEPTVESLVRRIWRLRVSEEERKVRGRGAGRGGGGGGVCFQEPMT